MMENEELRALLEALGELMDIHDGYLRLARLEPLDIIIEEEDAFLAEMESIGSRTDDESIPPPEDQERFIIWEE